MMKKLLLTLFFILLFSVSTAFAASDVTFEWNRNVEADMMGYRLYQSPQTVLNLDADGDGKVTIDELLVEPLLVVKVADIPHPAPHLPTIYTLTGVADGTWYWVLTAYDTVGNESGPSNEVMLFVDTIAPDAPVDLKITNVVIIEGP